MSVAFFTIIARNYFSYACVLGDSVKKFHPEAEFYIFIMDDLENELREEACKKDFRLINPNQLSIIDYKKFVFKYNVTEAATGVKPFVFEYLLNSFDKTVYLDPDILCFRRLSELLENLNSYSIIITPHSTSPIKQKDLFPDDLGFLISGIYNLGFIALKNDEISTKFIDWWKEKLMEYCIIQTEIGLFVDQKWIDLVPAYFDNVLIFKDKSYNMAYWNLHERILEHKNGLYYVEDKELAFFHFSGFLINDLNQIFKYTPKNPLSLRQGKLKSFTLDSRPDLDDIFQKYKILLTAARIDHYSKISYFYSKYNNQESISQLERAIFYKLSLREFKNTSGIDFSEPFSTAQNSFWAAIRKSGVFLEKKKDRSSKSIELEENYSKYYKYIHFILRALLKILGLNLYLKFIKFMRSQLLLFNHDFLLKPRK